MSFKITVKARRRRDGGLRVWSDDVPGLVLSHRDPQKVMDDIPAALEGILSDMLGCPVRAERLEPLRLPEHKPVHTRILDGGLRAALGLLEKLEFSASRCTA